MGLCLIYFDWGAYWRVFVSGFGGLDSFLDDGDGVFEDCFSMFCRSGSADENCCYEWLEERYGNHVDDGSLFENLLAELSRVFEELFIPA